MNKTCESCKWFEFMQRLDTNDNGYCTAVPSKPSRDSYDDACRFYEAKEDA